MKYSFWTDDLHEIKVACHGKHAAWMLIRNECHRLRLQIPTYDQIKKGRELTDDEMEIIRERQKKLLENI